KFIFEALSLYTASHKAFAICQVGLFGRSLLKRGAFYASGFQRQPLFRDKTKKRDHLVAF
ncbi:hypothetical protein, partial [uncultured Alteromonas sp.]|uniref:hypothetical protein n=1 Tax=uncultured Alteromonas sp. TaxID=179113 RepID=UPI0025D9AD4C